MTGSMWLPRSTTRSSRRAGALRERPADRERHQPVRVAVDHEDGPLDRRRVEIGRAAEVAPLGAKRVARVGPREVRFELLLVPGRHGVGVERVPAAGRVDAPHQGRHGSHPRQHGADEELQHRLGQRRPALLDAGPDAPDQHQASDARRVPLRRDDRGRATVGPAHQRDVVQLERGQQAEQLGGVRLDGHVARGASVRTAVADAVVREDAVAACGELAERRLPVVGAARVAVHEHERRAASRLEHVHREPGRHLDAAARGRQLRRARRAERVEEGRQREGEHEQRGAPEQDSRHATASLRVPPYGLPPRYAAPPWPLPLRSTRAASSPGAGTGRAS